MAAGSVAARYAQALFASVKAADEVEKTLEHLKLLESLMRGQPLLREFFLNPGVDPDDKVGLLDRVTQKTWSERMRAFMRMLTELSRAELLIEIVEAFGALVDADQGRVHGLVRSARKLSDDSVLRLRRVLEKREGKTVLLTEEVDPGLIGGIQVRIENRLIDGSVKRQLADLGAQLKSVSIQN
jgi:F-type H+-transporting ATPase subunit delta